MGRYQSIDRKLTSAYANRIIDEQTASLKDKNEKLEQFNKIVSHDLKIPLHSIVGFSDLALTDIEECPHHPLKEQMKLYWTKVHDAAKSSNKLVEDLLAYSKGGLTGLELENFPIKSILDEVKTSLKFQIEKSKATIDENNTDIYIRGNRELIRQVFVNLFSNSI